MSLSDKQKAAREAAIGSSDAATIAGLSPYKSPLELFYQLHGELPRYTEDETQAQRIGSKLEAPIAELTAEDLNLKIRRSAPRHHPKYPFMVANLDYEIVNHPKGPGILEIKNRSAGKPFDQLPDDIALQVAHQMAVTQRQWGIVGVLFGFGQLRTYEVTRDPELEEYLIELEGRFMVRVEKGEPPDTAWNAENIGILKRLYPLSTGKTIALDGPQATVALEKFLEGKRAIEIGENMKAEGEGWIKYQMAEADAATIPGATITWRSTKASQKFDVDAFKVLHPDLYSQFMKDVPGHRVFRVTPGKELKS